MISLAAQFHRLESIFLHSFRDTYFLNCQKHFPCSGFVTAAFNQRLLAAYDNTVNTSDMNEQRSVHTKPPPTQPSLSIDKHKSIICRINIRLPSSFHQIRQQKY